MNGFAIVPDPAVSRVDGIPLEQEPGLGALTLAGFLRQVTERHGPREAIAQPCPDGSVERWSYDDLWARATAVARALIACGVGKGTRVAILMTNRAEFVASAFGIALAGGVVTTFSTFSTSAELDAMLVSSTCSILLFEARILKRDYVSILGELCPEAATSAAGEICSLRYPFLRHLVAVDGAAGAGAIEPWEHFLARGEAVRADLVDARRAAITPDEPGVLLFSSGTSGTPKGILTTQRAAAIQMWRWRRIMALRDHDRVLTLNGFFWSGQFAMAIGGTFSCGGTLVMQPFFDAEATLRLYESERVTTPFGWPHQWEQLAAAANWDKVDLSAMYQVAEESPLRRHPTVQTDWPEPTRGYGNTETFTLSCAYPSGTPEELLLGSYGWPLPGMSFKVVDPETGTTLPMGERGELAIKGATMMIGYLGVPAEKTFDDQGYFRTGDGGYLDVEGRVFWEGRLNDIIKTGGANVAPAEVDARILQHPAVKRVQTIGVPDKLLGEMVVSCVVAHEGVVPDAAEVRAFAAEQLASFKVPRRVLFLAEADFAQTGSAKVMTAALRKLVATRFPER